MPGWSDRVRIVGGEDGYAYVPGQLLIEGDNDRVRAALGLLGVEVGAIEELPRVLGYTLVRYRAGSVPSAVRLLRAAGFEAQPNHVFFADAGAHPLRANPVYGNPLVGNPVYGNPVYGNPVYGNPVYGNPVYGNPVYGNPVYGNPVYGNPVYGNPVYGNPVYGNAGGVIGFVPGCPGGAHCCDQDPCTCGPARAGASLVYPNPILASRVYEEPIARRYQVTGFRTTTALPASQPDGPAIAGNAPPDRGRVRVAVLDTGWPSDPVDPVVAAWYGDSAAARVNAGDQPDADGNGRIDPIAGHGMFIGGLILRYAPGVHVDAQACLSSLGDGNELVISHAIVQAVDDGADILSLSFGTYAPEQPGLLGAAIRYAICRRRIVVASAGNDGTSRPHYPAAYDGVISVGALGPDGPAPFSNWGSWVRASAPGVDVVSSFWEFDGRRYQPRREEPEIFDGWAEWSGTSFSAPLVAAQLARSLQRVPNWANVDVRAKAAARAQAVEFVVDDPQLARLPCYGTIVNPIRWA